MSCELVELGTRLLQERSTYPCTLKHLSQTSHAQLPCKHAIPPAVLQEAVYRGTKQKSKCQMILDYSSLRSVNNVLAGRERHCIIVAVVNQYKWAVPLGLTVSCIASRLVAIRYYRNIVTHILKCN